MKKIFAIVAAISFTVVLSVMILSRTISQPEQPLTPVSHTSVKRHVAVPAKRAMDFHIATSSRKISQSKASEEAFVPQTGETTQNVLKEVLAISISRMESSK